MCDREASTTPSQQLLFIKRLHCKKWLLIFPSLAGMSLTKLSLAWNNKIIPGQWEFGK
jgi:hypothetical protein